MKAEEVMELAESAALFFRRLVDEGVPLSSAVTLTSSFVSSSILKVGEKPVEPWGEE